MQSAILFNIAAIFFCFGKTSGQMLNATCGPSYDWMLNTYRQNPCEVASYLGGVCEPESEFVVAALKPGEYYTGPSPEQSNPCRCSSVLYSLLSACAICQSRQCLSWSAYHHNCSTAYLSSFIGKIPAATAVDHWAYQNVTKYDGFNVSVAEALGTSLVSQLTSTSGTSSRPSMTPVTTTNLSNNSTPIYTPESANDSANGKTDWAAIGIVGFIAIAFGLAIAFKIWRKRRRPKSIAPSAAYKHRYSPIVPTSSQNTLLATEPTGSTSGSRNLPRIITPASGSLVSLPSLLYEPPEPSAYSPAIESSDVFTSHGGHSPGADSDRTFPLSHFVHLVPQRRAGGRG
ncbi:hypothetical protein B0H13DRAFT_1938104 [Mycena leptocephala]|nr:hypothetical protein B0H13DRAFT_1938104 [Mycena leptocephala]